MKQGFQKGNVIYLSGTCVVELSAIDQHSGINSIYYSVNGEDFKLYNKPLNFDTEGEFNLKFYAIDNVGNKEDIGERTLFIDTLPPVTTLEIEGPRHNDVISGLSKISFKATDANGVKETFYALNNGNQTKYIKPIPLSQLSEGEHSISWYSVDLVGNTETENKYDFFVDKTPPMVFEEIVGNTYMVAGKEFSSGRSQLRVVAVDNKAGVKEIFYSINSKDFKLYEKPIYLSEITGAVTIRSYATDNVGNKGTSDVQGQQFSMPEVDISGPNISHSFIGNKISLRDTIWISPKTKVSITANDKGSGLNRIDYKLNGASPETYSEAFSVSQSGYHKVSCTAWDNVDNLNITDFEFGVDAQSPELFLNFSVKPYQFVYEEDQKISVYSSGVILYLAATDDISVIDRIMVSINGAKERAYNEPLSGFKSDQTHEINIRVLDKLGNENLKTLRFRVQ